MIHRLTGHLETVADVLVMPGRHDRKDHRSRGVANGVALLGDQLDGSRRALHPNGFRDEGPGDPSCDGNEQLAVDLA